MASEAALNMDSEVFFTELMSKIKVPEPVQQKVQEDYSNASELHFSFFGDNEGFESFVKKVLLDESLSLGLTSDNYRNNKHAGQLRRLKAECGTQVAKDSAPSTTQEKGNEPQSSTGTMGLTPVQAYVQERLPPLLSLSEQDRLTEEFKAQYPCEILTEATMPAKDMLRRIMQQKKNNNMEWVPWTNIVSKAQERKILETKGANGRKRGAPLCDQAAIFTLWEDEVFLENADISASPHWVSTQLTVRSHALAMLGIAHLAWLKDLDSRLMDAYTKKYQQDSTIRALNNKELVSADHEIWQEVYRLARQEGFDVNRAIALVLENGLVARELAGRPSLPQNMLTQASKGKGTGNKKPRVAEDKGSSQGTKGDSKGEKGKKRTKGDKAGGKGQTNTVHETTNARLNGKAACHRYNNAGVGCNDSNCKFGHFCNVRMPNGNPCGGKHPAHKHDQNLGVRK